MTDCFILEPPGSSVVKASQTIGQGIGEAGLAATPGIRKQPKLCLSQIDALISSRGMQHVEKILEALSRR